MADSIISPNDIADKGTESASDFVITEHPDEELTNRFSGLVSSEGEEGALESQRSPVVPTSFQELEKIGGGLPPVQGSEKSDFSNFSDESVDISKDNNAGGYFRDSTGTNSSNDDASQGVNGKSLLGADTLGDQILKGIQGVRERVERGASQVESNLQPGNDVMGMREMFQTQWTMTNLMITEDFIGKIVSKGTQAFDSLLRNQ